MQQGNIYRDLIESVERKVEGVREQPNIKVKPLSSFANNVYKVEVAQNDSSQINGKTFLIKIFRQYLAEFSNKTIENQVVSILSNHNLYPHVYFVDRNYRVQEFISGYAPSNQSITDNQLGEIMRRLGSLVRIFRNFSQNKPESYRNQRKIQQMFSTFEQVSLQCQTLHPDSYQVCKVYTDVILQPRIRASLEKIVSPELVPTHNDCHFHNVIIQNKDLKLFLIDFQFFSPNYRGFELGNFFNQYATDYDSFEIKQELQLPQGKKDELISIYYKEIECNLSLDDAKQEVEVGRLLSHLFWLFIGVKQVRDPKITIDMQYYIRRRFEEFMKIYKTIVKAEEIK